MVSIMRMLYFMSVFIMINGRQKVHDSDLFDNESAMQMKGILSVMIIIGHCANKITSCNLDYVNVGFLCVGVFYFWSGYGVAMGSIKKTDYLKSFWRGRLSKVLVPFALAHCVYIPVKMLLGIEYSIGDVIKSFYGQKEIVDHSWYAVSIVLFYFIFWCSNKITSDNRVKSLWILLGTVLLTVMEAMLLPRTDDWWYISNLAFAIGVYAAYRPIQKDGYWRILLISIIGNMFSVIMIPLFRKITGQYYHSVYVISANFMSCTAALMAILIFGMRRGANRILKFLGEISYEIYLLHGLFILLFMKIGIQEIILIPAVIAATMPSAVLFHRLNRIVLSKINIKSER